MWGRSSCVSYLAMQRLLSPASSPGSAWVTPGLPSSVVHGCPSGTPAGAVGVGFVAAGAPVGMHRLLSPEASPGCAWVTPGLPSLVVQDCPSGTPVRAAVVVVFAGAWCGCVAVGGAGFVPGAGALAAGAWCAVVTAADVLEVDDVIVTLVGLSFPQAVSPTRRHATELAMES